MFNQTSRKQNNEWGGKKKRERARKGFLIHVPHWECPPVRPVLGRALWLSHRHLESLLDVPGPPTCLSSLFPVPEVTTHLLNWLESSTRCEGWDFYYGSSSGPSAQTCLAPTQQGPDCKETKAQVWLFWGRIHAKTSALQPRLVWLSGWAPVREPKGCQFDSQWGHIPGLQPGPQEGACERQPHIAVSLPLFLPPFPSV